jgi:hypothetical protein
VPSRPPGPCVRTLYDRNELNIDAILGRVRSRGQPPASRFQAGARRTASCVSDSRRGRWTAPALTGAPGTGATQQRPHAYVRRAGRPLSCGGRPRAGARIAMERAVGLPESARLGDEGVVRAQLWRRLRSGASKSRIPGLCLGAQRAFSKRTLRNLTHRGNACTSCRCRMGRDRCGPHRPRPRGIGSGMTARIHGRRSQAAHEPRAGTRSGRGRGTRSA